MPYMSTGGTGRSCPYSRRLAHHNLRCWLERFRSAEQQLEEWIGLEIVTVRRQVAASSLTIDSVSFCYAAFSRRYHSSGRCWMFAMKKLYRHLRVCLLLVASLFLASQPAWATKRVALVVGNSNYQNAPLLPNPANDASAIAATLKGAGFDVVDSRLNLAASDMRRALREFADQTRDADIALVYYAGHGIEIDGTNYLIPTDARLERDTDIYDEAFSLDRVLLAIEPARQLRVVIVDACRNNPFADTMK